MKRNTYSTGYGKFATRFKKTARFIGTAGSVLSTANKAYQIATQIASIINSEKKFFDAATNGSPRSGVPVIQHLTGVSQGDADNNRNGDSIGLKALQMNGILTWDSESAAADRVRLVILMDKDNEAGTPPTAGQVYEMTTDVNGLRNMEWPKRFRILMDKVYTRDSDKDAIHVEYYKKFKMMKDFNGNPTQMKHITWQSGDTEARNHIYIMMICNNATVGPTFTYRNRIRFYDN